MDSILLRQMLFGITLVLWGTGCYATTIYVATHTFKLRVGKGFFNAKYVEEKFEPPHAKDIKVAGVNAITGKVVCQYIDEDGILTTTYRATISGKTVADIENAMTASSYFDQFNLSTSDNFKPVVVEAPATPLVELATKSCSGSASSANEATNKKIEKYVYNGFVDKPENFPESDWSKYLKQCHTNGNPTLASFDPQIVPPTVIAYIYLAGLGLILLGFIAKLIYQHKYGVRLEKDDPLLVKQKELKQSIKKIKENCKQPGLGPAEGKKLDEELENATKELKEVEHEINAKLKKLMDKAIAKADARRAAAKQEKEKEVNEAKKSRNDDQTKTNEGDEENDHEDDKIDVDLDPSVVDLEEGAIDEEKVMESVQDAAEAVGEKLAEKLVGKETVQKAKKLKNSTLTTVSQVLTVLSGLLSIISALILLSNYLSGSLSILDVKMRLDGYKFAHKESIIVKPQPFSCDECTYTFSPSSEILKTIKSRIPRNGSSTIKKNVDDDGVSREIPVSYQQEGNTFTMESAWVMLPSVPVPSYQYDESHTACIVKQPVFADWRLLIVLAFFVAFSFGVTFIEVVAEFDSGIFQRLKDRLGMSREISLMHGKYRFTVQDMVKRASPVLLSLPLNFLLANLQDVGAPLHLQTGVGIFQAKSDKAPTIIGMIVSIALTVAALAFGYCCKAAYNLKCCKAFRRCSTICSRYMNVLKRAKTRKRTCKEKMKEKCNECLLWSAEWFTRLILILLIFSFYAIIFLETFDGNIGFGAFLFSVDFPIIAPKINLPAVYMNLSFQIINKIRLILAIVAWYASKTLAAASKISVDKDLLDGLENGEVDLNEEAGANNDDEDEGAVDTDENEIDNNEEEVGVDEEKDEANSINAADDAKEQVEGIKEDVEELIDEEEDEDIQEDAEKSIDEEKEKNDKKNIKKVDAGDQPQVEMTSTKTDTVDKSAYKTPSKDKSASEDFSLPSSRRRSSRSRRRSSTKSVAL